MKMHTSLLLASVAVLGMATAAQAQVDINSLPSVTDEMLANPEDGDWPSYGRNIENYRFSPLSQINKDNVGQLTLAWARALEPGNMESAPIEFGGVMFIASPGDVVQAIDAETGKMIWEYRRQLPDRTTLNSIAEAKRGIALYEDKIYLATWDDHIVALDAKSGQVVWDTDRGGVSDMIANSSGPIVANGVVVAGSTCQYSERGCYVTGHDAATGEELWRNTFIPQEGEEGDDTWGDAPFESRWITGAWGQMVYDPELDLVYYGSTGAGPASETQRGTEGGSMFGTNTRFAVKPKTGEIVWRHQVLPRDNWDQECTYEMVPVDLNVQPSAEMDGLLAIGANAENAGEKRVLTGVPCKTGILWQFDAATGEFIYARSTVQQTLIESVDDQGQVTINEAALPLEVDVATPMCPTFLGGRDWAPTSFNPETKIMYVPLTNMCADVTPLDQEPTGLDAYNTELTWYLPEGVTDAGRVDAINVETGETLWSYTEQAPVYAPVTATGGGLVFVGGVDRRFKALDAETGELVWSTTLGSRATGHPMTYEVDGRQYVAIPAGGPGFADLLLGATGADVDAVSGSNMLYVFALPEQAGTQAAAN
jgi:alcohol dehydrogenase (cytochrome c)